jgi:hypothetical protein
MPQQHIAVRRSLRPDAFEEIGYVIEIQATDGRDRNRLRVPSHRCVHMPAAVDIEAAIGPAELDPAATHARGLKSCGHFARAFQKNADGIRHRIARL